MGARAHRAKFVDRMFVLMHTNYGHLWSSRFPTDDLLRVAKAQWALRLSPWSERCVEQAIDRCFRVYRKPPTLTEFIDLLRTDRSHCEYKALPRPPCDKAKAKKQIEAMRSILQRSA